MIIKLLKLLIIKLLKILYENFIRDEESRIWNSCCQIKEKILKKKIWKNIKMKNINQIIKWTCLKCKKLADKIIMINHLKIFF